MLPAHRTAAVVVVDDEPETLLILQMLLKKMTASFELIGVSSGRQALAIAQSRHVPLLITDYNMPEMDGLALTTAVKALAPATHVVMITAQDSAELQRQARAVGVDTYMMKPFPLIRLEAIVRDIVRAASSTEA
jgi:CheY-like chemotaxis protein